MDARDIAVDAASADRLARQGLRLGLVDAHDRAGLAAWEEAEYRGFHEQRPSPALLEHHLRTTAYRRTIGVWDPSGPEPEVPVATTSSWITALTVPGGVLPSWAISCVTVAPTHRRRGIARALLEAELRTARRAGVPMSSLTATEATIYRRYGFGPATRIVDLTIDTTRTGWSGPTPAGRVSFVTPESLAVTGRAAVDRALRATPGEVALDDHVWAQLIGTIDPETASRRRAVRYDDETGTPQGLAVYTVLPDPEDFQRHRVEVHYLRAATDDAHAALWRLLVELDLVSSVRFRQAPEDDPVLWCLGNPRAATVRVTDMHWLRLLDVPAVLRARRYEAGFAGVIGIVDPAGDAGGAVRLRVAADGTAEATVTDETPDLELGVDTLASLCLGGGSVPAMARAGLVAERTGGAIARLDAAFRTGIPPYLSFDY